MVKPNCHRKKKNNLLECQKKVQPKTTTDMVQELMQGETEHKLKSSDKNVAEVHTQDNHEVEVVTSKPLKGCNFPTETLKNSSLKKKATQSHAMTWRWSLKDCMT